MWVARLGIRFDDESFTVERLVGSRERGYFKLLVCKELLALPQDQDANEQGRLFDLEINAMGFALSRRVWDGFLCHILHLGAGGV